ncbi:ankyrin repeat domain-containing protein [Streptomyces sp. I05A-00742]|uniref:ankyrin repeat domain-containing protein n=1 Tax=Streptomyces sp. I05A-00742 TaxID=2732853 RepID=UPI001BB2B9D8|nr:ankyrin repeat domain-containing protein [Streptomyces sp. I05A-00742]
MGFFDGLVVPDEPEPEQPEFTELGPSRSRFRHMPPADWYVPTVLPRVTQVGAGPRVRVVFAGWEVWPEEVTLCLDVFWRQRRTDEVFGGFWYGREGAGALRVGLRLADGRRVTTLDGEPWLPPGNEEQPVTLREYGTDSGSEFHRPVRLLLSCVPSDRPVALVLEWPDEGVPETATDLDTSGLDEAARRVTEIWPELTGPADAEGDALPSPRLVVSSPSGLLAAAPTGNRPLVRADWYGIDLDDWTDLGLIKARLRAGAVPEDPDTHPLHTAAGWGSPEVVTALLEHTDGPDLLDHTGVTPLWEAVRYARSDTAAVLLAAGADAWKPLVGHWSPGRLAFLTPLAPMFEDLPGAEPLTPEERAAHKDADRLTAVFADAETDGLGVAFVAGIDEDEVIRRLGGDPADFPPLDLAREPGPYGTGPAAFDPDDYEASLRYLGVRNVPGGCVLTQPMGYLPSDSAILEPVSAGTAAYGLYFNPNGGTFGTFARDGRTVVQEEIGMTPAADDPPEHWFYRFWQVGEHGTIDAGCLAYACHRTGLRLEDADAVDGPPSRWIPVTVPAD